MSTSPTSDLVMRLSYSECSDSRFLITNYVLGIAFGTVLFLAARITIEITKGSKEFNTVIELFASWILIQLPFSQCSRTQYLHTLGQQPIVNFLNGILKPEITKLFGYTLHINRKRRKLQEIKQRELFGDTIRLWIHHALWSEVFL